MAEIKSYCEYVEKLHPNDIHKKYHDHAYGFPLEKDSDLFGRLILEINQAGLSWSTILNKETNFYRAYDHFNIKRIAGYGDRDKARLLADASIIRNRLKVEAAIHNANVIISLKQEFGSFKNWLDKHHPLDRAAWTKLFKKHFRFTGGEIVNEFLMSTGYLPGAHIESCPVFKTISKLNPPWME
jgi:DNA-3-methyladenine glycosylase I